MSSIFLIIYKYRPGPSTSNSMAADKTERSEQSEDQNISTKKSKSSTLDETVKQKLKQKKKGDLSNYSLCLQHTT